jgi:hypothetical protein
MSTLRSSALPIFSGLLGTMGIANGLYCLNAPVDGERVFGILVPQPVSSSQELQTWQKAQTYARGIRNFAGGLGILGITAYWRFSSLCQASPVAGVAARRCLGVMFLTGSIIGAGDGLIISRFADGQGTSEEAKEVGKKAGFGHMVMAVPILVLGASLFFG